jgi:nucleotide-binding universal stress UspA family protein
MSDTTEKKKPQIEPLSIKQIVVAVDLSPHSEKTVTYAVGIARGVGAAITLVHVYRPAFQSRSGPQDYAPRALSRLDLPRAKRMRQENSR